MAKVAKKRFAWKGALAIGLTFIAAAIGGWSWKSKNEVLINTAYSMGRVVDGDSFDTADRQLIRLASVNAPEIERCGGTEAKLALEKFISGKPLHMKIVYKDNFGRLISFVYADGESVNKYLLENGYGTYQNTSGGENEELKLAGNKAKTNKKGVYGSKCWQEKNSKNEKCSIKANRDSMTYHFPGCGQYNNSVVQLHEGDEWYCDEKTAIKNGYKKGADCFEMKYEN